MDCSHADTWAAAQVRGTREDSRPLVKAWVNGQPVWALVDSGCTRTLVQQAQAPPLGDTLLVQCIHGDVRPYGLRWAEIRVGGKCQSLPVGVVPQLNYGAVIGRDWPRYQSLLTQGEDQEGALGEEVQDGAAGTTEDPLHPSRDLRELQREDPMLGPALAQAANPPRRWGHQIRFQGGYSL